MMEGDDECTKLRGFVKKDQGEARQRRFIGNCWLSPAGVGSWGFELVEKVLVDDISMKREVEGRKPCNKVRGDES